MTTTTELLRIDREIEIKASPERVYRALTDRSEISTWFRVTIDGEIAVGNEIEMRFHEPYSGQRVSVKIVELTPPKRFVWQWHPGAVDPKVDYSKEHRTTVTFTIEPTKSGSKLSVAETGFDLVSIERRAKVLKDNTQGWTEVIVWIKDHAEKA
jgi:uncharacterized protein YndB with AHSA1/START domain